MDDLITGSRSSDLTMDCGHGGWDFAVVFASARAGGGELWVKQIVRVRGRGGFIATMFVPCSGMVRSRIILTKVSSPCLQQAEEDNCNGDREKGGIRYNLGAMSSSCDLLCASSVCVG